VCQEILNHGAPFLLLNKVITQHFIFSRGVIILKRQYKDSGVSIKWKIFSLEGKKNLKKKRRKLI
jgi:hypothetical protein